VSSHDLSDHNLVVGDLSMQRYKQAAISYVYRNLKNMDIVDFEKRLRSSQLFNDPVDTPDKYIKQLESTVTAILDEVAPIRHGTRPGGRKAAKWLDPEAVSAKQHRRQLERRWKKSGCEQDRVAYRASCRRANLLINSSRNKHRYQRIKDAGRDSRRVWGAVKDLLYTDHQDPRTTLPDIDSFCSLLAEFFVNKVRNIKDAIASKLLGQQLDPLESDKSFCGTLMSEFQPVTVTEVERLIRLMPSKSSPLDAFPTSLIKQCSSTFAPVISRLANLSFEHATFPSNFKTAQVTPLLKKHGLDASDPANYRPISNLNTISKILERLVLTRIVGHVSLSPNFDVFQSAYKRHHSTETALLKLTDDIFARFDDRQSTILVALDQSAAFDCIDHTTLIRRLHHSFGVTGITLSWIKSYLESRSMYVRMKQVSSSVQPLETGVPQGSVLGPLLFCLYISPLSRVIRAHGINYHQYADDTQVYIAVSNSDFQVKLNQLETCTASIHSWLQMNGLQLNPNKSEVIQFTAARGRNRVEDVTSIQISNAAIKPSSTIKSLGVTLDTKLSFDEHVTNVCRLCYCHIRALRHVRASLPNDVARTVACSII
jgi:Reverse transcriptase (RNA-dependent DNA polymerase)